MSHGYRLLSLALLSACSTSEGTSPISHLARIELSEIRARLLAHPGEISAIPRTPVHVPCGPVPWPSPAPQAWQQLGYTPNYVVPFSFEVQVNASTRAVTIRAYADRDCDGDYARFEMSSDTATLRVTNEAE